MGVIVSGMILPRQKFSKCLWRWNFIHVFSLHFTKLKCKHQKDKYQIVMLKSNSNCVWWSLREDIYTWFCSTVAQTGFRNPTILTSGKKKQENFVMFDIANEIADIYNNAKIKLPHTCWSPCYHIKSLLEGPSSCQSMAICTYTYTCMYSIHWISKMK